MLLSASISPTARLPRPRMKNGGSSPPLSVRLTLK
ncbi:hypothetical protein [Rhizobium herbae]